MFLPERCEALGLPRPDPASDDTRTNDDAFERGSCAFKGGGKKIEQRVVQALATLVRYAEITDLRDGPYAARRAA